MTGDAWNCAGCFNNPCECEMNHGSLGDTTMPDTRNTVARVACLGNLPDTPAVDVGEGAGGVGVGTAVDGAVTAQVSYRIRIVEPVEVSSRWETHLYTDRGAAMDTVHQIAVKLAMRGITTYRIHVVDDAGEVVWAMTKPATRRGTGGAR